MERNEQRMGPAGLKGYRNMPPEGPGGRGGLGRDLLTGLT